MGDLVKVAAGTGPEQDGIVFDVPSHSKVVVAVVEPGRGPVFRSFPPKAVTDRTEEGPAGQAATPSHQAHAAARARRGPRWDGRRARTRRSHARDDAPHDRQVARPLAGLAIVVALASELRKSSAVAAGDPDLELRQAAVARARDWRSNTTTSCHSPRSARASLRRARVSFGSFQKGIHRSQLQCGPAALTLTTSFKDPYADAFDATGALSPTPIAPARSTKPTTARCARPLSCGRRSSTSAPWRRVSTSSSPRCS